jgi:hypothetical protein
VPERPRKLLARQGGVRVLKLGGGHGKERNEVPVASSNWWAHGGGTREKWGGGGLARSEATRTKKDGEGESERLSVTWAGTA